MTQLELVDFLAVRLQHGDKIVARDEMLVMMRDKNGRDYEFSLVNTVSNAESAIPYDRFRFSVSMVFDLVVEARTPEFALGRIQQIKSLVEDATGVSAVSISHKAYGGDSERPKL